MNSDGTGVSQLTHLNASDLQDPNWSPDGTRLAFVMFRGGAYNVFVVKSDGSGLGNLTPGTAYSFSPSWSPSGTQIAFDSRFGICTQVYVMNANGQQKARVTSECRFNANPDWSPDGSTLVFGMYDFFNRPGLATIAPDGTGLTQLTDEAGYTPNWSPDGTMIAFEQDEQVFTIHSDGTGLFQVTHDPRYIAQPDWQPIP